MRGTHVLVAVVNAALIAALLVLGVAGSAALPACLAAAVAAALASVVALTFAARAQRHGELPRSLAWTYAGYAAAVCLTALIAVPVIDRWQDLAGLARRIHADRHGQPLALLDPDETTIAMLDHGFDTRPTILTSTSETPADAVAGYFHAAGGAARVLVLLPGHTPGPLTDWLARFHALRAPDDGEAARLIAAGAAALVTRYQLPQGRRYALLGPPPQVLSPEHS